MDEQNMRCPLFCITLFLLFGICRAGSLGAQQIETREAGERPIDLPTALRLAHVDNPEIRLARERVREALARRQFAAANSCRPSTRAPTSTITLARCNNPT